MSSWKFIKRFVSISCVSFTGASLYYLYNSEKFKTIQNAWTKSNDSSSLKWTSNWDNRDPIALVKPFAEGASREEESEYNKRLEKVTPKYTRNIILTCHGEYTKGLFTADKDGNLTQLGREQAKMIGERLKELQIPIDEFIMSTMVRAKEMGKIVLETLPNAENIKVKECSLIEEGVPIPPEPKVDQWKMLKEFNVDGPRVEAAFRKYFHRAEPTQEKDSFTVLVCHANVIRYFVCRALQLQPEAWLSNSLNQNSITWLSIHPSGRVVLKFLGDCGYFPTKTLNSDLLNIKTDSQLLENV